MNKDYNQVRKVITVGERLRNARESMGLSQQAVAERLYLKISTIRGIEENYVNPKIALIFFRGYIRAYARLVNIPEEEVMLMLSEQCPIVYSKSVGQQNISFRKINYLQQYHWLVKVSWLLFFIFILLMFIYYCCYYKTEHDSIVSMYEQSFCDHF